jgi:RNA polymerase sigma-70 factor (ECF subfamily)
LGPTTDRELVSASLAGDGSAYAELVKQHAHRVFAVCLGVLCNVEDAEDMVQETFIRAHNQLGRLRDREQFSSWTRKIAHNLCVDYIRRESKRKIVEAAQDRSEVKTGDHYDLQKAIMQLAEEYRIPLLLYYFDGRSTDSVAKTLQLSSAGVRTRLSRARKELRNLLAKKESNV